MKKFWKATAAVIMGATFAFSAVACTDGGSSVGNSSVGGSSSGNGGSSSDVTEPGTSVGYVSAALEQLAAAKSAKISVSGEISRKAVSGTETVSDTTQAVNGELVFSATDAGVNAHLAATMTQTDNASGLSMTTEADVYVLDGYVYTYNEDRGFYEIGSLLGGDDMADMILSYLATLDFGDFDEEGLIDVLAALLDEYGEVSETSATVSLSYDGAFMLNMLIAVINGVDEETTTLEQAINTLLALLSEDVSDPITVDAVLDEVKAFGAMTLVQAAAKLDEYLEPYGFSLDDVKGLVVEQIPEEIFTLLAGQLSAAQIAAIKTGTVAEVLAAFGMDEVTVNDLIGMIMAGQGGDVEGDSVWIGPYALDEADPSAFDLEAYIDEILKPMLKETTLADANIMLPPLDGVSVSKAKLGAELVIGTKIEKLELNGELGFTQTVVDEEEGRLVTTVNAKFGIGLEDLSSSPVAIELPADAETAWAIWELEFETYTEETDAVSSWIYFYYPAYDEESEEWIYSGKVSIYNEDGISVEYEFTYQPLSSPEMTTLTVTVVDGYWYGAQGGTFTAEELAGIFPEGVEIDLSFGVADISAFPATVSAA